MGLGAVVDLLMMDRAPVRRLLREAISRLNLGSYRFRYRIGALPRMKYAYIIYQAARLAERLGLERISVLEFGVAGGDGLVWMERHAEQIERIFRVKIEIYGFDTGEGLPEPRDYRDLPYHWKPGFFRMDKEKLLKRLSRAKVVFGDVAVTAKTFFDDHDPAPIGAVSHDLDFYSSTVDGFHLFEADEKRFLPRVFCYFDDVLGGDIELYSDYTGERLAIEEFNAAHQDRKIAVPYHLRGASALGIWQFHIWILHLFQHGQYNQFMSAENQQLPLSVSG
jgi:hypothetical protein